MAEKKTKTFRFSEEVLQKIKERNKTLYQYETQYIEAAVLAFEGGEKAEFARVELLEKRIEKLEQEVFEKKQKDIDLNLPNLPDLD